MLVKVKFFKPELKGYAGGEYTYSTDLELKPNMLVIAPTFKGDQKAIVTQVDIPYFEVPENVREKLRHIDKLDTGEV